jgi:hypothetical protein
MLVYANHLKVHGTGAEAAVFRAIGGWLKEQLGFGLHPDELREDGQFSGNRGDARSWLRVYATRENEPALYALILKNQDETVRGRHWITEIGLKIYGGALEGSCVVKTDEHSTVVASRSPLPVPALLLTLRTISNRRVMPISRQQLLASS